MHKGFRIAVMLVGSLLIGIWLSVAAGAVESASVEVGSTPDELTGSDAGFVHPALEFYAREHSVSLEVAGQHLDRIDTLQDILASIRERENARIAGWGIDHGADFAAWIWLTGDEPPSEEVSLIADLHDDVTIRLGADHTYRDLRSAGNDLKSYLINPPVDGS